MESDPWWQIDLLVQMEVHGVRFTTCKTYTVTHTDIHCHTETYTVTITDITLSHTHT